MSGQIICFQETVKTCAQLKRDLIQWRQELKISNNLEKKQ